MPNVNRKFCEIRNLTSMGVAQMSTLATLQRACRSLKLSAAMVRMFLPLFFASSPSSFWVHAQGVIRQHTLPRRVLRGGFWWRVLRRVLGMEFAVQKGSEGLLRGFHCTQLSRRCLERSLRGYDPLKGIRQYCSSLFPAISCSLATCPSAHRILSLLLRNCLGPSQKSFGPFGHGPL